MIARLSKKRNKGITLIALVVTIIVLLILAGISISMITGENGILGRATEARDRSHEASAKEELDMWLMEYVQEEAINGETDLKGFLEAKGATVTQGEDGKYDVETGGEVFLVDPDTLESKLKEKGIPRITVEVGEENGGKVTVTVNVTNSDEIDKIDDVILKDAEGNKVEAKGKIENGKVTFEVDKNGTYTVEVSATTEKKQHTTQQKVSVNKITTTISQTLGYGTIDVIWVNTNNEVQSSPNSPNLYDGNLTKVTWTEDTSKTEGTAIRWTEDNTANSDWYDYKAADGQMQKMMMEVILCGYQDMHIE